LLLLQVKVPYSITAFLTRPSSLFEHPSFTGSSCNTDFTWPVRLRPVRSTERARHIIRLRAAANFFRNPPFLWPVSSTFGTVYRQMSIPISVLQALTVSTIFSSLRTSGCSAIICFLLQVQDRRSESPQSLLRRPPTSLHWSPSRFPLVHGLRLF
jgi:hypothetical protein